MMKFRLDVENEDIEALEKSLNELPNAIVEIYTYEFGRNVVRSDRSYDFALVSSFANVEALERYQRHPDHLKVVEMLKNKCEKIITVDFEGTDASSFRNDQQGIDLDKWQ
jgi:hypothetical protein